MWQIFFSWVSAFISMVMAVSPALSWQVRTADNFFDVNLYEPVAKKAASKLSFYYPDDLNNFVPMRDLRRLPPPKQEVAEKIISASSSIAVDVDSGETVFSQDCELQQPIASITKLMTALVALDHKPEWQKNYRVNKKDERDGGKLNFFPGDEVTVEDLFKAMLVASDNGAVISLIHSLGLTENEFVAEMNKKAQDLNLAQTKFFDPTGLDNRNVSTAKDVAKFALAALNKAEIQKAVLSPKYSFKTAQGKGRTIYNTDQLLKEDIDVEVEGGKTGYLNSAGYCFVGKFSKDNKKTVTVVLGANSKYARFAETKKILNLVYNK